ncbi:hypothetical protein RISK_002919 [Rhodopirellula islandica]|uniref:Uncharacterized protein n=1 Tax=Rhodopirellula islandica TaxID=595434 RepID=A0A0J1BEZ7_RHOIS|nr:hypothetical protein RISK_002919 [Rhodopirellula islandica]
MVWDRLPTCRRDELTGWTPIPPSLARLYAGTVANAKTAHMPATTACLLRLS